MCYEPIFFVKTRADAHREELLREAKAMRLLRLIKRSQRRQASQDVATVRSGKATWKQPAV
jgi:hypothetical protein